MVLELTLLGLVWLLGLTAVHCVHPAPMRRCRAVLRVIAEATARTRPRMPEPCLDRSREVPAGY